MQKLLKSDLYNICRGAGFFSSGGGGSVNMAEDMIELIWELLEKQSEQHIKLINISEISDETYLSLIALAGDPSKFNPKTLGKFASINAIKYLEKKLHKKFNFLLPGEIGSVNILVPMLVAAQTNKAVVNCSGAPRAVPRLQDTIYYSGEIDMTPIAFANDEDKTKSVKAFFTTKGTKQGDINVDGVMRAVAESPAFNNVSGFANFVMKSEKLKKILEGKTQNTVTMALKLGQQLQKGEKNKDAPFKIINTFLLDNYKRKSYLLISGTITKIKHTNVEDDAFEYLEITIQSNTDTITVKAINENLLALKNNNPIAMAPDLISWVGDDCKVYSNDDIKKEQKLNLIGTQASAEMREKKIVEDFSKLLTTLGYSNDYIPIENLNLTH